MLSTHELLLEPEDRAVAPVVCAEKGLAESRCHEVEARTIAPRPLRIKKTSHKAQEMLRKLVCFLVVSSVAALVPPSHRTPRRRSVVVNVEKREAASL